MPYNDAPLLSFPFDSPDIVQPGNLRDAQGFLDGVKVRFLLVVPSDRRVAVPECKVLTGSGQLAVSHQRRPSHRAGLRCRKEVKVGRCRLVPQSCVVVVCRPELIDFLHDLNGAADIVQAGRVLLIPDEDDTVLPVRRKRVVCPAGPFGNLLLGGCLEDAPGRFQVLLLNLGQALLPEHPVNHAHNALLILLLGVPEGLTGRTRVLSELRGKRLRLRYLPVHRFLRVIPGRVKRVPGCLRRFPGLFKQRVLLGGLPVCLLPAFGSLGCRSLGIPAACEGAVISLTGRCLFRFSCLDVRLGRTYCLIPVSKFLCGFIHVRFRLFGRRLGRCGLLPGAGLLSFRFPHIRFRLFLCLPGFLFIPVLGGLGDVLHAVGKVPGRLVVPGCLIRSLTGLFS